MKSILILFVVMLCSGSVFAADLECVSSDPNVEVNLQADISADGVEYQNIQFEVVESGRVIVSRSYPDAVYDFSYKPRGSNKDRIAFRIMQNKNVYTNYTFFRPKNVGSKFLATLGEKDAGFHNETEYYFLACTQK